MSWNKIKTFLIILLVSANIFFAVTLINHNRIEIYDNDTIDNVLSLLRESGIYVDKAQLEKKDVKLDVYKCAPVESYITELSSRLGLGKECEKYATPNGVYFIYQDGTKLQVEDNYNINFTNSENISQEILEASTEVTDNATIMEAKKLIKKYFSPSDEISSYKIESIKKSNKYFIIQIEQTINNCSIYEHKLQCVFDSVQIISAYGRWCFLPITETFSSQTYDLVNILLNEKISIDMSAQKTNNNENKEDISKQESTDAIKGKHILEIKQCFCPYLNNESSELLYVPSYMITYSNGTFSVYNSVTGKKY